MTRFVSESALIRERYPAEYADLAVVVTDLGGSTLSICILALLFWLTRRRESLLIVSYATAGLGLILIIKTLLALPRPPATVHLLPLDSDPYGFPSGHAFAAVVVYGGLLSAFDLTRNRLAVMAVTVLITLISLSRVVLGYHYLGDVIAGAVLGAGFLVAMNRLTRGDPQRGFALALVLAVPALVVTGLAEDAVLAFGGALGGLAGSSRLDALPALRSRVEGGLLAVVGCGFIISIVVVESAVDSVVPPVGVVPVLVVVYAVLVGGIIVAPAVVGRLDVGPHSRSAG